MEHSVIPLWHIRSGKTKMLHRRTGLTQPGERPCHTTRDKLAVTRSSIRNQDDSCWPDHVLVKIYLHATEELTSESGYHETLPHASRVSTRTRYMPGLNSVSLLSGFTVENHKNQKSSPRPQVPCLSVLSRTYILLYSHASSVRLTRARL